MNEEFITFTDLTGQRCCVNHRHIIAVLQPSMLSGEAKGIVIGVGMQIGVTIPTAYKIIEQLSSIDLEGKVQES